MPGADVVFDEFAQQNGDVDDCTLRHELVVGKKPSFQEKTRFRVNTP